MGTSELIKLITRLEDRITRLETTVKNDLLFECDHDKHKHCKECGAVLTDEERQYQSRMCTCCLSIFHINTEGKIDG